MKNSNLLIALSKGLKVAIEKIDDDTVEWVKGVPGNPVWASIAVKGIREIEASMAGFLTKQKKLYIKRLKKLKLPVKKADTVEEALIEAFKKMITDKILNDDEAQIKSLQESISEWELPIIEKVAQEILILLDPDKEMKDLSKAVIQWLKDHVIKFAQEVQETTHKAVIDALTTAFKKGKGIEEMANLMEGLFDFSRERAKMVARTEVIAACNAGTLEGYRQSEVVVGKRWVAVMDSRTRGTHRKANGQVKKLDEPFIVGGYKMMHPGDSSLGAPAKEVIHERCTTEPVLEGEEPELDK